jgi:hypothetical protein
VHERGRCGVEEYIESVLEYTSLSLSLSLSIKYLLSLSLSLHRIHMLHMLPGRLNWVMLRSKVK